MKKVLPYKVLNAGFILEIIIILSVTKKKVNILSQHV